MTWRCFDASARFLLDRRLHKKPTDGWRLVHGIAVGQGPIAGVLIGHAWVESMDNVRHVMSLEEGGRMEWRGVIADVTVHDVSGDKYIQMPAPLYYGMGKIREENVRRYTYAEMVAMLRERETYGAWELPRSVNGVEVTYA